MLDLHPPVSSPASKAGLVLLVDDEPQVLRAYARVLRDAGLTVVPLDASEQVEETITAWPFDVVISDIRMPGTSGINVLRSVRLHDPDLPVVLTTAGGDLTSAMEAVAGGAFRYLLKPVAPSLLAQTALEATRLRRLSLIQRRAFELYGNDAVKESEKEELSKHLDSALSTLTMAYQPIVRWGDRSVFAYEALVRNDEPTLRRPDLLLEAAEKLGRTSAVGRAVRRSVAATLQQSNVSTVFVNLHPRDLEDDELLSPRAPLSAFAPRVVLEVTERASLSEIRDLGERVGRLRQMGYRMAVDDLGAGYAGLSWFARLEPEIVKLDMSLTRGIDREPTKQKLVEGLARLCTELGILVVGEGVETRAERDRLHAAGCDFLQGYLFARPGAPFPVPDLDT
jgi:EAL domain-containing protein (putative c-di-GMP-specific phosphodiesterase class I)/ActR/RegA family two-component response regulator